MFPSLLALTWTEALDWIRERPAAAIPTSLLVLALAAWTSLFFVRLLALPAVGTLIRRSPNRWDDAILEHGVLDRLTWAVPLLVLHQGVGLMQALPPELAALLQRIALAGFAVVAVRSLSALLAAVNAVYHRNPQAKERPIKGLLQVANLLAYLAAGLFILAALLDRSPLLLLSGLGAMTAILMLVFRDSLLSLVAGIQVTSNDLLRLGDWIEMPQFNADGDVVDIALNTISVQNWDKTITVIPAHKFLEHSFKNWRGMRESGGRRIKRSIHIDLSTIRFLTEEEVEAFARFHLLSDYIASKRAELEEHNRRLRSDPGVVVNVRRLTNLGTLRAYITRYLRQHPGIHQELTFLVRQLQPTAEGLPLEIYVFTNDVRWAVYEGIQSDIFDHILAAVPQFGLRLFQNPTGADFSRTFGGARPEHPQNRLSGPPPPFLTEPREID